MCTEVSTILITVAAELLFNCWYLEIPSDNCIRHVPWCVHYHAQAALVWYGFTDEKFVACCEG
jgi:hypothetical protein